VICVFIDAKFGEPVVVWKSGREVTVNVDVRAWVSEGVDSLEERRRATGPKYLIDEEELESRRVLDAFLCRVTRSSLPSTAAA
jgi:hypothetical protein